MKKAKLLLSPMLALGALASLVGCNKSKADFTIGILQPLEHVALSAARKGFTSGCRSLGMNVDFIYQNASGSSSDLALMARSLVSKCDLVLGIATDPAIALQTASENAGSGDTLPILFTAVTDPVGSNLIDSFEHPGGMITGTSDMQPVEAQISLIKEILPDASKLGVFYHASEINSQVQAQMAHEAASKAGLSYTHSTCTDQTDLVQSINSFCASGIDALFLPTDNLIAANMLAIKNAASENHVLVVCGEEGMLSGGHVTLSIDYNELGRRTALMAKEILVDKKSPNEVPATYMSEAECEYVMNSDNLEEANIVMPEAVLSNHDWRDVA